MIDQKAYRAAVKLCNFSEQRMLDALLAMRPDCLDVGEKGCFLVDYPYMRIMPQYRSKRIGAFRLDFAVVVMIPSLEDITIDVECDGHEFHKLTKAQVDRDNFRNHHLQALGWRIMRFSGSRIWQEPERCAEDVQRQIESDFVLQIERSAREDRRAA